jgi:hypothetical protein
MDMGGERTAFEHFDGAPGVVMRDENLSSTGAFGAKRNVGGAERLLDRLQVDAGEEERSDWNPVRRQERRIHMDATNYYRTGRTSNDAGTAEHSVKSYAVMTW